ncbi:hypothetical protein DERF_009996 [Dermatophagoides farinae]|uniref:Uncharacterized protein n=1 Tax=Dermatophagoides farinae TaxID=6954 RepID=A0A922HW34_DERFA|nr:hypothetical protein DERF_009996 [Dermatophagoides farinae]
MTMTTTVSVSNIESKILDCTGPDEELSIQFISMAESNRNDRLFSCFMHSRKINLKPNDDADDDDD